MGAFLEDGTGYQASAYKENVKEKRVPPPGWLDRIPFPNFSFVDVYSSDAIDEAETTRAEFVQAVERGDLDKAAILDRRLKRIIRENNLTFDVDDGDDDSRQQQ